jgi:hypothetical protein
LLPAQKDLFAVAWAFISTTEKELIYPSTVLPDVLPNTFQSKKSFTAIANK